MQWTNYLYAGGERVGMRIERDGDAPKLRYFHTDRLGSITTLTEECGEIVEQLGAACPRGVEAEPGEQLG